MENFTGSPKSDVEHWATVREIVVQGLLTKLQIEPNPNCCQYPLMNYLAWNQVGIVSFGDRCGKEGSAGVYTKVSEFIPWIKSKMEE